MSSPLLSDPIDPALAELLALFEGPLERVAFPDVDRATLVELGEAVRRHAADVAEARAMLESAEAALDDKQQALLARGQRALAYARIYAIDQPALAATLERINLPRGIKRALVAIGMLDPRAEDGGRGPELAPRRRGRPPKVREDASLFGGSGEEEVVVLEGAGLSS